MKKKISIIIPTFNSQSYISKTLNSVLKQTYKPFEIIVVDDFSKDKTVKIVKSFIKKNSFIKLYQIKSPNLNRSPARPRNYGIQHAKGEYICFLDSDDLWDKDKLYYQIKNLKNNYLLFTDCKYLKDNKIQENSRIHSIFTKFVFKNFPKGLLLYNPFRLSSVLIRKNLLKKYFFRDEKFFAGVEDLELWLRIFKDTKKDKFFYDSKKLVTIRRHDNNLTKNYYTGVIQNIFCISEFMLKNKINKNLRMFVPGIFFRIILIFWKENKIFLKKISSILVVFFFISITLINNSKFIELIGNPLIVSTENVQEINKKNIFIISGHGFEKDTYLKYQIRVKDFITVASSVEVENIFILANKQIIPENFVIESLLYKQGYNLNKVKFSGLKESTTFKNSDLILKNLTRMNINNITIITDRYHTLRIQKVMNKKSPNLKINFYNSNESNNFKTISNYSKFKIIVYEYISLIYYKIRGYL